MNKKIVVLLLLLFSLGLFGDGYWEQLSLSEQGGKLHFDSADSMFVAVTEQEEHANYDGPVFASVKRYDSSLQEWVNVANPKFSPALIGGCLGYVPLSFVCGRKDLENYW